ncbi:ParB N-terminal domain-containing protein [Mycobacteroides abscessus]|uniref:ParB N-terminal domain-containing protein n=1 Tax=Mycobacteroides abscessus TaxID=36809 RepID=UPI0005DF68AE|nr:ParB N-terminal domain-containing protein [Mycobacteroides abscessus]CPR79350.1 Probable chromosome partitioning protein ParB [Mycobacteroides abscessus]CPR88493.1 Probable chromosome partitioning protein ParB [Mycobacteroides abscessus]CPS43429.1 Probable chromosome partitioning protein ParB [Mycobacteroides abscessus]CPV03218.1 Probable chromosome partitioning protein ParB [Mycobacteroides abscessus]
MTDTVSPLGEVQLVQVDAVRPAAKNPRKISQRAVEVVAESLREFGWQQPLVVDKDYTLIVGHTRLRAAKLLGIKHVPVVVADGLTPEQVKAYRIADNRTGDFTTWDFPELVQQLDELAADFSDVLALADWQAIVQDFEEGSHDVEVSSDVAANTLRGFEIVVVFKDEERAIRAQQQIIDMDGVIDIRHKFNPGNGDSAGNDS